MNKLAIAIAVLLGLSVAPALAGSRDYYPTQHSNQGYRIVPCALPSGCVEVNVGNPYRHSRNHNVRMPWTSQRGRDGRYHTVLPRNGTYIPNFGYGVYGHGGARYQYYRHGEVRGGQQFYYHHGEVTGGQQYYRGGYGNVPPPGPTAADRATKNRFVRQCEDWNAPIVRGRGVGTLECHAPAREQIYVDGVRVQ